MTFRLWRCFSKRLLVVSKNQLVVVTHLMGTQAAVWADLAGASVVQLEIVFLLMLMMFLMLRMMLTNILR